MSKNRFKVTPFTNPSGAKVWRVSGSINGKQIRKNFSDEIGKDGEPIKGSGKRNAKAFCDLKEIERLNRSRDVQTRATRLTAEEIRDAEKALDILRKIGKPLSFAAEFTVQHYVPTVSKMPLADAVEEYVNKRFEDARLGHITEAQAKRIRGEVTRFERHFSGMNLDEVTTADVREYLSNGGGSLKTWNNRRTILLSFYKYCLSQDDHTGKAQWIERNPVTEIPHHGKKAIGRVKGEAEVLSAAQAAELMAHVETFKDGRMVNFFAIALFAGIRPDWQNGEMAKIRPEHFDLDAGMIHLPHWVSKVGETRSITIQPNLMKWLRRYSFDQFPIIPPNCKKLRLEVRKKFNLGHDVLRHTFCSFLYSKTKDLGDTARQAGNSADIIRAHYANYRPKAEVKAFWSIVPRR